MMIDERPMNSVGGELRLCAGTEGLKAHND